MRLITIAQIREQLGGCSVWKFHQVKMSPGFPKPFPGFRGRYVAEQIDAWIASQSEPQQS